MATGHLATALDAAGASASILLADVFAIVRRRACPCALHKIGDRTVQSGFAVESLVLARQGISCKSVKSAVKKR